MDWENNQELKDILEKLHHKYSSTGQDLQSYLEGLYHTKAFNYWDYIHLDTLLSLQNPVTGITDEPIFIMYHQITELYFKLILHELNQVKDAQELTKKLLLGKLERVTRYFHVLADSFDVMSHGMEREQFLTFRKSLQPASGFQSRQYREIEFISTPLENLVHKDKRYTDLTHQEQLENVYWRQGGIQKDTGKPAHTNVEFEKKYWKHFTAFTSDIKGFTIWDQYMKLPKEDREDEQVIHAMKSYDSLVNVNWPLRHYRTAMVYLAQRNKVIEATGGSNWQEYLPPKFQKRIFFPELWTKQEKEDWGRAWVENTLGSL
ncbi:MAG: tryptophan 2,3-dioxygenase family protein [Flavobacteriales bacterium]|jgi:tryptophan 2,3-dioxygenase|nr:tryptophan 2,3-dioxygenase family protein [Flavobacteriales bacterium]